MVTLLLFASRGISQENTTQSNLFSEITETLEKRHYTREKWTAETSRDVLHKYLKLMDSERIYFFQSDIDDFTDRFSPNLHQVMCAGDFSSIHEINEVFLNRVSNRVDWIEKRLQTTFHSFNSDRTVEISRSGSLWPENETEADSLWALKIEDDLLFVWMERSSGRSDSNILPRNQVLDRYQKFLESRQAYNKDDLEQFFLKTLPRAFDPHSKYYSPTDFENFRISNQKALTGIGALLAGIESGETEVRGIVAGGPAYRSGELQIGDRIVAVGEGGVEELQDIRHSKLNDTVNLIRGAAGSIVQLKVIPSQSSDPSETKIIAIERGKVDLKGSKARAELIEVSQPDRTRIGWIDLPSFYESEKVDENNVRIGCTDDVELLLTRLKSEAVDGIILDLSDNGGGKIDQAVRLLGLFLGNGPVAQIKDSEGKIVVRKNDTARPVYDGPLIVLTSASTASASEVVASALQDYERAVIVGDRSTYGMASINHSYRISRGVVSAMTQVFFRVTGNSLQLKGVIPDIILPSKLDAWDFGESSYDNPVPYEEILPQPFERFRVHNIPLTNLRQLSQKRVSENPSYQWIEAETFRQKDLIEKNRRSLNMKERQNDIQLENERKKSHSDQLATYHSNLNETEKGKFTVYGISLDNYAAPELKLLSNFTDTELTGMKTSAQKEQNTEKDLHGFEPTKRETVSIMMDFIKSLSP